MADFSALTGTPVPMPPGSFVSTCDADFPVGTPVYSSAAGACNKARANAAGTATPLGLALFTGIEGRRVRVKNAGPVDLSAAEWAGVVSSDSGALVAGARYFLSQGTAGKITRTEPESGLVVQIGVALSTTCLLLQLLTPQ